MEDKRRGRRERILQRLLLLGNTPEELLPEPRILEEFIQELQRDIIHEATDFMGEGDYVSAFEYLGVGVHLINLKNGYGITGETTIDERLLILRAQCNNKLGFHGVAIIAARSALAINPQSVPAMVEITKANFAQSRAGGLIQLMKFGCLVQGMPDAVKDNPEVRNIIQELDGIEKIRLARWTANALQVALACPPVVVKPSSERRESESDWIPGHNKTIADMNQKAKEKSAKEKGKKKKVKEISDGAEPDFKHMDSSQKQWNNQGARPKTPLHAHIPDSSSSVSSGVSSKQSANDIKGSKKAAASTKDKSSTAVQTPTKKQASAKKDQTCTEAKSSMNLQTYSKLSVKAKVDLAGIPTFHRPHKYVCSLCFTRQGGAYVEQRAGSSPAVCAGQTAHAWNKVRMMVYCSEVKRWCKVRARHAHLTPETTPKKCDRGQACTRSDCWFPHFKEEVDLWIYMGKHKLKTLDEVMLAGRRPQEMKREDTPSPDRVPKPPQSRHDCTYCKKSYHEPWQLEQHLKSQGHRSIVNTDTDKEWKLRSPPWNVVNGRYQECPEHKQGRCIFSEALENNCIYAHSQEELDEWKERHRYRVMKIRKAKAANLYRFMDDVLAKYNFSPSSGGDVIAEQLPGIRAECAENLARFLHFQDDKNEDTTYTCTWTFILKTSENTPLRRVCLFYDDSRLHFRLSKPAGEREAQVCPGNSIVDEDGKTYRIEVIFLSNILGCFSQWVLFDLGTEPYLVRKLQVQVGSATERETFEAAQKVQRIENVVSWNSNNSDIVRFEEDEHPPSRIEKKLMEDYPVPASKDIGDLEELSRENYRDYMHKMLYLEEQECNHKLSKFSTNTTMKCQDHLQIDTATASVFLSAVGGTKYGIVDLQRALMDDSETSQIIERSVTKLLIKFNKSDKIYEAIIPPEQRETGKGQEDILFVKLSPACVKQMHLVSGPHVKYKVEIQLQLNRLPFCFMHASVDRLQNMDMVFPPKDKPQKLPPLKKDNPNGVDKHQERAVQFISQGTPSGAGPVLICGPFGTGKTHTLAAAVKRTLEVLPESKILICTLSNSAADLYISEHLHKLAHQGVIRKMIRVYAVIRNIKAISETVRRYVLIHEGKVQIPSMKEIKANSVVITTLSTAHKLEHTELYGHFTHILIDEAGQALETEALQPLTLASGKTCVVLAGDHKQMSPKVFSQTARHAQFHKSLLERLFYRKTSRLLLSSNYRTCQEMLDFISMAFYHGAGIKHKLSAVVDHKPHPKYNYPLVFSTVKGVDQKVGMSYVNHAEIDQIVEIVKSLRQNWPEWIWGELNANSVCVITPYRMQVGQIRSKLRESFLGNIGVETVHNVQGKQFRVLIISTVRTRNTLNKVDTTALVSTISAVNRPDDKFDYGFLSDPRLLNTACTRAQSLLMVVGDPTALCSVGECSTIWRRYLKECENNNTLLPRGTSIEGIKQEIEASKQRLNPCAAEFKPSVSSASEPAVRPKADSAQRRPALETTDSTLQDTQNVDPWLPEDDSNIPDGIMRELYRQISQDQGRLETKPSETSADPFQIGIAGITEEEAPKKWRGKPPKFRMVKQSDRIVLDIDFNDTSKKSSVDARDDDDNDGSLVDDRHDERQRRVAYKRVKEQPDKYKICSFQCETSGQTFADPLDEGQSGRILITSKRRRGRALHLDEVIVEILVDEDDLHVSEQKTKYGKVICICKRASNSALMSEVVCKLDAHIRNQMVPIDRTLPKFYVLRHEKDTNEATTGHASPDDCTVSLYHYRRDLQEDLPFVRNVKVSRKDREHKLFLVHYVKWFADAPYPMGVVTKELPQADDKETGLRILKLLHGIKDDWKLGVVKQVEENFPDDWQIPEEEIKSRYDARRETVFTIDPPDCQDLDDALSVRIVDGNYRVGIHIADVSYFVSKDTAIDKEARNRSTSFYPSFAKPINMLPPRLSNKLCSLLPNQDRLTISVVVSLDKNGSVINDIIIRQSVIHSCRQLTYDAVENIIQLAEDKVNNCISLDEKIWTLSKLAEDRRKHRLKEGRFAFSHDAEEEEVQHPLAHSLVEEMMLLANEAVARYLVKSYNDCSPLRRQLAPSDESVDAWLKKHGRDLPNSLDLQSRHELSKGRSAVSNDVQVLKGNWGKILGVINPVNGVQEHITKVTDLITSDENHPQLAVAKAGFYQIQEGANYISTGDYPDVKMRRHHTLDKSSYTHFTSPIRRYIDIVVHRMLIAAMNDEKARDTLHQSEKPYTSAELASICHHCNIQHKNSKTFENKTREFRCALRLREAPWSYKVYVGGFSDANLNLIFPHMRFLPSVCKLKLLKLASKPEINEDGSRMELKWKERIFELHGSTSPKLKGLTSFTLDTDQMVFQISADQWQEILDAVKTGDFYKIKKAVGDAEFEQRCTATDKEARQRQRRLPENRNLPVEEITCETSDPTKPSHSVTFQRGVKYGDVVKVQLNASVQRGLLAPRVQLFYLTPKLCICAEHRMNAIECFAQVAKHRPPSRIDSIQRYKEVWLPILKMVSAYSAVVSDESIIIHDVDITWRCEGTDNSRVFKGVFTLKQSFCTDRSFAVRSGDYLCIRYKDVPLDSSAKHSLCELQDPSSSSMSSQVDKLKTTFVAHAAISAVTDINKLTADWTKQINVVVNQYSSPFPDTLQGRKVPTCTIELIPKASSDRRPESAVSYLHEAEPLVQSICLHHQPDFNQSDPVIRTLFEEGRALTLTVDRSPFPPPNQSQNEALRLALQQPFTVIQGPPGTGKTVTGAHLTYFFTEVNKKLPDLGRGRPQVLYCGPSNKAVDVVAHYLMRLGVLTVRVYNSRIEQRDFPVPGSFSESNKKGGTEAKMDPQLTSISLHHLIRQNSNRHYLQIRRYEVQFARPDNKVDLNVVEQYKQTIRSAEVEELQKYNVVLCTCNEAGSRRIQKNVNMVQCIVDEAGMCNEPETLIPLVGTIKPEEDKKPSRPPKKEVKRNPRQVVLIGDHKQLRPIIQETTAVQLGMETSLLEKYGREAKMLTIQYRMHESICEFPSEAFYKGKLLTADSVKRRPQRLNRTWPGGPTNPLVFCHHVGLEVKQSVRTEEGNEQSRANPKEVEHVVRIASRMVFRLGVSRDKIVVLTQYRLQRAQIAERLKSVGLEDIAVSTVITSQGREWDYVILSTVRSMPRAEIDDKPSTVWKKRNLGFICDENQINVAITRPKSGLIIIGNKHLLAVHKTWKDLLAHYKNKNALVDAKDFPK